MTAHAWLIPLEPSPAVLKTTLGALEDCAVTYTVFAADQVREQLDDDLPAAAIVHGGVVTPELFDVQRWLAEFHIPTLMLVEGLTDHYEASLLDRGARDVIGIPTSTRRLRSRLDALTRPPHDGAARLGQPGVISVTGLIEIHAAQRTVQVGSHRVSLTRTEFDLLHALAMREGKVVTRHELAGAAGKPSVSDRALESHISRIRIKLRAAGAPDCIDSVRSVGYRLQAER